MSLTLATLNAGEARAAVPGLAEVLHDCVAGNASVSFIWPFGLEDAHCFFEAVADGIERGETALIAASLDGRIAGTVQLGLAMTPNQPHRADVKKLLVHRDARGRGIGEKLMRAVEPLARAHARTLLVLDTASAAAERIYQKCGWTRLGTIPNYALNPDGSLCDTVYFYKQV